MEHFTVGDVLKATKGHLVKGEPAAVISRVSTDSRASEAGDLFVALKGDRFDGHDFVAQAVGRGATGILVSKDVGEFSGKILILVEDTRKALGDVARLYRDRFDIPVVGITGSNGKTTTKDMAASVLSQRYSVLRNEGNFNNAIGVPLTLFRLTKAHDMAVIEMGTGAPGEMSRLIDIARPDVAVVTNVGPTHLEFFGSMDEVAAEKGILARAAGAAVLNADDPRVAEMRDAADGTTILFGIRNSADVVADEIEQGQDGCSQFTLAANMERIRVHLPFPGRHQIYNALAAASLGILFHVKLDEIKRSLEVCRGLPMRMQKVVVNGATIIDDTYNSNPASLRAAVDYLSEVECECKRVLVLGDMLELGKQSGELHLEAGRSIAGRQFHSLVTVGDKAAMIAEGAMAAGMPEDRAVVFETNSEAVAYLRLVLGQGDIALIKGSRGMKMEEIVGSLESER